MGAELAMDLATLADLAQVVGLAALLGGGGFALLQLRNSDRLRADAAAIEILRVWQTVEESGDVWRILSLPEDAEPDTITGDPATLLAVMQVAFVFEALGLAVFERVVDLHVLDRALGGVVRRCWRKLRRFFVAQRTKPGAQNEGEWFQWLYERLEADPAPGKDLGAHVAHAGWQR